MADFNGNVFCSAFPLAEPVNIADRDYFKRAIATRDFSFGGYQIGRITGKPTLNFGYPVINNVGSIDVVVFAALDLNALNDMIDRINAPGNSSLTVTDGNNVILVAFPRVNDLIGKTWGKDILEKLKYHEGTTEGLDIFNAPSILGVAKIELPNQSSYLNVIVGMPLNALFKDLSFSLSVGTILFLISIVITTVLGWLLGSRIIKKMRSEI